MNLPLVLRADGELEQGKILRLKVGPNLAVVAETITVTHSYHRISSPGSDLATVNGGQVGQVIVLQTLSTTAAFKIKPGGNLDLKEYKIGAAQVATLTLLYDGTFWQELARKLL